MDFDEAIQAHSDWKLRIYAAALNGNQEGLDPDGIAKETLCHLGKWLFGEGRSFFSSRNEYDDLVRLHADFHHHAALLVIMINRGQGREALAALENRNSGYSQASLKVTQKLIELKSRTR